MDERDLDDWRGGSKVWEEIKYLDEPLPSGVDSEKEFADMFFEDRALRNLGVERETHLPDEGHGMVADAVIEEIDTAIELKRESSWSCIAKAIGQSEYYRSYGYKPLIVTPRVEGNKSIREKGELLENLSISYLLYCPESRQPVPVNVAHSIHRTAFLKIPDTRHMLTS